VTLVDRDESPLVSKLLHLPRLLLNPSLQLAFLVRIAQKGPVVLLYPLRWLEVIIFSSEIHGFRGPGGIVMGPGIAFPHPWSIIIGRGVEIGAGVTIYNNTNIGSDRHLPRTELAQLPTPRLGDRSVIYAYSAIQGAWDVGHDAVVGIHVVLDEHVPPGALKTVRKLRSAGEWPGEQRARPLPFNRNVAANH
jgi:serine acetyltransferase